MGIEEDLVLRGAMVRNGMGAMVRNEVGAMVRNGVVVRNGVRHEKLRCESS